MWARSIHDLVSTNCIYSMCTKVMGRAWVWWVWMCGGQMNIHNEKLVVQSDGCWAREKKCLVDFVMYWRHLSGSTNELLNYMYILRIVSTVKLYMVDWRDVRCAVRIQTSDKWGVFWGWGCVYCTLHMQQINVMGNEHKWLFYVRLNECVCVMAALLC